MKLPKSVKYSETEKSHVWRIAKFRKFNVAQGKCYPSGRTLLLRQPKDKLNRLYFYSRSFYVENKIATNTGPSTNSFNFLVKNGKLYIYKFNHVDRSIRDFTAFPSNAFQTKAFEESTAAQRRFLAVLKLFLKQNNYKYLPKIGVKSWNEFLDQIYYCCFPLLKTLKTTRFINSKNIPKDIFRKDISFQQSVKLATGSKGKRTVKLFAEAVKNYGLGVYSIRYIKNLVSLDYLQKRLECREFPFNKKLCNLLKIFPEETRINLINSAYPKDGRLNIGWEILDTIRIYNEHKMPIPNNIKRTWDELHNYIAAEAVKIKKQPREIKYKGPILEIDGAQVDDISLELPKNTHKLVEYGRDLSHCVGTYDDYAVNKRCEILAVYKDNILKYCIELRGKTINQFRGKHNCDPDKTDEEKVITFLKEKKIINDYNSPHFI